MCTLFVHIMRNACQLYTVMRTNFETYEVTPVSGYRSDWNTISELAREIQKVSDPEYKLYDYRVGMCD